MTTLMVTLDDALLARARELCAMIEDPTCDAAATPGLTRDYFGLLRRLRKRGVSLYATGGR